MTLSEKSPVLFLNRKHSNWWYKHILLMNFFYLKNWVRYIFVSTSIWWDRYTMDSVGSLSPWRYIFFNKQIHKSVCKCFYLLKMYRNKCASQGSALSVTHCWNVSVRLINCWTNLLTCFWNNIAQFLKLQCTQFCLYLTENFDFRYNFCVHWACQKGCMESI